MESGHRKIGFCAGNIFSTDSNDGPRRALLQTVKQAVRLEIPPEDVVAMDRDDASPKMGATTCQTKSA